MPEVMTHTPAETALIDALAGADGWLAQLRDVTRKQGMPTRRDEMWKWSDLRAASAGVNAVGAMQIEGVSRDALAPEDGETVDIAVTAKKGASARTLAIKVQAGRRVCLVERYRADVASLGNFHLDISIEPGGRLDRICIHDPADGGILVSSAEIKLHTSARLEQIAISFGGKLTRNETHVEHAGEDAIASLNGVYLLDEGQHCDFTSLIHHTGPGGITMQLVKGAVAANARGVFQGKFKVDKAAQQTDARMTHRALMLDGRAEIDAKPELEIYADDVQCAHGNAIGALDETALFYMRQRGIPEARARAILIESFLSEPLDNIENEVVRDELRSMLSERLEAMT